MRWIAFAVVLGVNIVDALDATIASIAGPSIHVDLGGGTNTVQWPSAGYTLTSQIRQLEIAVGTALLRAGPDGRLTLTAHGHLFARDVRPALESLAQSRKSKDDITERYPERRPGLFTYPATSPPRAVQLQRNTSSRCSSSRDRQPSYHRTPPSRPAPPREITRAAGRTHRDARSTRRPKSSLDTPRNGHRNPAKRLPTPLPGTDSRPLCVRGPRNTGVCSTTR